MTYREKAMEVRPDLVDPICAGGMEGCPFEVFKGAGPMICGTTGPSDEKCTKCWGQEYKGEAVLPKEET